MLQAGEVRDQIRSLVGHQEEILQLRQALRSTKICYYETAESIRGKLAKELIIDGAITHANDAPLIFLQDDLIVIVDPGDDDMVRCYPAVDLNAAIEMMNGRMEWRPDVVDDSEPDGIAREGRDFPFESRGSILAEMEKFLPVFAPIILSELLKLDRVGPILRQILSIAQMPQSQPAESNPAPSIPSSWISSEDRPVAPPGKDSKSATIDPGVVTP